MAAPRKHDSRAGAPGYSDYDGISWGRPADARRAKAAVQLAELKSMRGSGVLHTKIGDREVWYRSDAELVAAIASLEAELSPQRVRNVVCRPVSNKGW